MIRRKVEFELALPSGTASSSSKAVTDRGSKIEGEDEQGGYLTRDEGGTWVSGNNQAEYQDDASLQGGEGHDLAVNLLGRFPSFSRVSNEASDSKTVDPENRCPETTLVSEGSSSTLPKSIEEWRVDIAVEHGHVLPIEGQNVQQNIQVEELNDSKTECDDYSEDEEDEEESDDDVEEFSQMIGKKIRLLIVSVYEMDRLLELRSASG